jgi:hypothetical protein
MSQTTAPLPHDMARQTIRFAEVAGIGLIAVGGLLAALQLLRPHNGWAIFILIPAIGMLTVGGLIARHTGRRHLAAAAIAAPGIVALTAAMIFLFSASWTIWWPLMLAAPGIALCLIGLSGTRGPIARAWLQTIFWTGIMMACLAAIFLAGNLALLDNDPFFPEFAWWGAPMLIPGIAAIYNALRAARTIGNRSHAGISFLFAFGLSVCAVAAATLGGAPANAQIAAGLMASGLGLIL